MCRGNGGQPVYADKKDREAFLKRLGSVVRAYKIPPDDEGRERAAWERGAASGSDSGVRTMKLTAQGEKSIIGHGAAIANARCRGVVPRGEPWEQPAARVEGHARP